MGLKTTYYLRTMAASGIEKSTLDLVKDASTVRKVQATAQEGVMHMSEQTATPVVELKKEEHASAGDVLGMTTPKLCLLDDPTCEACQ